VTIEDVDVFVPHQANLRIVQATARALELRPDAVIADDIIGSGNTSAASIPLALDRIFEQRQAKPQALALLVGFGAGLAYAAQVIRLP
jgi:3-oxoacyl-[acyl-carrier-protein] synthase III